MQVSISEIQTIVNHRSGPPYITAVKYTVHVNNVNRVNPYKLPEIASDEKPGVPQTCC